jgi:hypothetical protein
MLNSNQGWTLREITAAVGREYGWPALNDIPEISSVAPDVPCAGTYESASGKIMVARDGNRLLREFAGQQALPVYPAVAGTSLHKRLICDCDLPAAMRHGRPSWPSSMVIVQAPSDGGAGAYSSTSSMRRPLSALHNIAALLVLRNASWALHSSPVLIRKDLGARRPGIKGGPGTARTHRPIDEPMRFPLRHRCSERILKACTAVGDERMSCRDTLH